MTNSIKDNDSSDDYNVKALPQAPITESPPTCINLTIPSNHAGLRLDQALAKLLPNWSRSRLQSWINNNCVTIDGKTPTSKQKIWGSEQIVILPMDYTANSAHTAENIHLEIIYEDESLIIINKPAGLVTHPGNGNWQGTMLNALLHHAPQLENIPRAGIVHRLDKNTSGLLAVAKTIAAQISLVRQLQHHTVKRDYLALVLGKVEQSGTVDAPIGRHPVHRTKMSIHAGGKPARTHYQALEVLEGCTLLRCSLETGRTHQIRVHMNAIGHPLVGDPVYSGKPRNIRQLANEILTNFPRQALHAQKLALTHPETQQSLEWEIDIPDDMEKLLRQLQALDKK